MVLNRRLRSTQKKPPPPHRRGGGADIIGAQVIYQVPPQCLHIRGLAPKESTPMHEQATASVPLRARDGSVRAYAIIDASDAEWVAHWRWSLHMGGYAFRLERVDGRSVTIFLHRAVLGLPPSPGQNRTHETDHINRNRLDNRRGNLRFVSRSVNMMNRGPYGRRSAQRGHVEWRNDTQKWRAFVWVAGRRLHLGSFAEHEDAERAVAVWHQEHPR